MYGPRGIIKLSSFVIEVISTQFATVCNILGSRVKSRTILLQLIISYFLRGPSNKIFKITKLKK